MAEKMGLGTWKEEEIALLTPDGEDFHGRGVKKYGNPDFHVDRTEVRKNIWTRMAGALKVFQKKPYIDADKCVRCGTCVQSCPVPGKAVDFRKGKGKLPVYDYRNIRCFCAGNVPKESDKVKLKNLKQRKYK